MYNIIKSLNSLTYRHKTIYTVICVYWNEVEELFNYVDKAEAENKVLELFKQYTNKDEVAIYLNENVDNKLETIQDYYNYLQEDNGTELYIYLRETIIK